MAPPDTRLFRVSHAEVERIWRMIALSTVYGPLSKTAITRVQVECCALGDHGGPAATPHEHLIKLYMPNIFEEAPVRNVSHFPYSRQPQPTGVKVLLVLLERHAIEPTGVKPDMYTSAGINSSHPSRIRTTIWRPSELLSGGHAAIKVSRPSTQIELMLK